MKIALALVAAAALAFAGCAGEEAPAPESTPTSSSRTNIVPPPFIGPTTEPAPEPPTLEAVPHEPAHGSEGACGDLYGSLYPKLCEEARQMGGH